jgi:hypothetical protein
MIDRIAAELERSDIGSSSSPGLIGTHINDAIRAYKAKHWWFLQEPTSTAKTNSTTASNSYVSLVTGIIQIDTLQITVSSQLNRLTAVDHSTMEALHEGTSSEGQPWNYSQYGKRVRLYPTPDDIYTLTWTGLFEESTTLSSSSDTNDWMTNGELLIRRQAKMTILRDYLGDPNWQACSPGIGEAIAALDLEHMRRQNTRKLKASM